MSDFEEEPIDTKRCTVHIDCKNKRNQPDGFALAEGTGQYKGTHWLGEAKDDIADDMGICTDHCRFKVKIRDEHDGKWEKPITLNGKAQKYVNPLRDRIFLKIRDEAKCKIGSCTISDYSSFNAQKSIIGKTRKAPKTRKTKKRRRLNEADSDEEEHDNDEYSDDDDIEYLANKYDHDDKSTDSDEDDPNKYTKKTKKKKPGRNAKLWSNFVETMNERFGGELTMPGIVKLCKKYFNTNYFPEKIPKAIKKKYGIKRKLYSRSINHNNYDNISTSPNPASPAGHISNHNMVPMHQQSYSQQTYPQQNRLQTPYIHHHVRSQPNIIQRYQYQHYSDYQHQNSDYPLPPPIQHQHNQTMPSPDNSAQDSNDNTNTNNSNNAQ